MKKKKQQGQVKQMTKAQMTWHQFKKNKGAVIGLIILCAVLLIAVIAQIVFNYSTDIVGLNILEAKQGPSASHIFGTDDMGRDVFKRVLYGAKYSLLIGVLSVAFSLIVGTMSGAIAGYYGGKVETVIMRIVEIFLMIPTILLTIVIVAMAGASLPNLILALGLTSIPYFARNARASVITVRDNEYVEAAKALGVKDIKIIFTHILPNALSPILVQATARIASCIVDAATFSFIGLGVPAPAPEWGSMLANGRNYMSELPTLILFPGIAIVLTVLAINLIGDGLRDALDPKLKR